MNLPLELWYTEEHEWVKDEGNNQVRVGITDFAQSELGDIVFVELPEEGAVLKLGEPFGSVESVKTVSELYSPVNGTVISVNTALESSPENVNAGPYSDGWMILVETSDAIPNSHLISADKYKGIISN